MNFANHFSSSFSQNDKSIIIFIGELLLYFLMSMHTLVPGGRVHRQWKHQYPEQTAMFSVSCVYFIKLVIYE